MELTEDIPLLRATGARAPECRHLAGHPLMARQVDKVLLRMGHRLTDHQMDKDRHRVDRHLTDHPMGSARGPALVGRHRVRRVDRRQIEQYDNNSEGISG